MRIYCVSSFVVMGLLVLGLHSFPETYAISEVPEQLQDDFEKQPVLNVVISLGDSVKSVMDSINSRRFANSVVKTTAMVDELEGFTASSQRSILSLLSELHPVGDVEGFWITNKIYVRNARLDLIETLITNAGAQIEDIRKEVVIRVEPVIGTGPTDKNFPSGKYVESWGLGNIHTAQAHQAGFRGQGVVVGVVDSGARGTHEALASNMRPSYNWYDPWNFTTFPFDDFGHGTHTTGTAVGAKNGVAPGASWIHCKLLNQNGSGSMREMYICAQWILCPTLPDGTNRDCSKKPHVCSNSWGYNTGDETIFDDVINAWRGADIIPVFSIGNDGPDCRTARSPGDQPNLISVGATKVLNRAAKFSSRGPVNTTHLERKKIKPELAAPGSNIASASNTADDEYAILSGTSMACPHVAGSIAVLLSKKPSATYDEIFESLRSTTYQPVLVQDDCNLGTLNTSSKYPNNVMGYGIIRLDSALQAI